MVTFWICGLLEWNFFGGEIFGAQFIHVQVDRGRRMGGKRCLPDMIQLQIYTSFDTDFPTDRALLRCRTNASPMNAIAMPKQNPAAGSRAPLLPDLFLLVLKNPLAHGLLAGRLELLVDLLKLLNLLLGDLLLGLEVGAEPALDALYAVRA